MRNLTFTLDIHTRGQMLMNNKYKEPCECYL